MTAASDTPRTSPLATLGWIVFVLLVVYAVLIGGGWAGIYLGSLRLASLAIVALGLIVWLALSLRDPRWQPRTAIWPTLVLPIAALALTTVTSWLPRLGLEYVAWAVLLVALYLLLVRVLATETARARIGALAAMLSLVIGLLYMGQVLLAWIEWWGLIGGFAVPPLRPLYASLSLGGPGTVQAVQIIITAIAIAGLGLGDRRRQAFAGLLIAITAIVVVLSASRSGWVALAGALTLAIALWLVVAARAGSLRERIVERWAQRGVKVAVGAAVIAGAAAAVVAAPVVLDRLLNSGTGGRGQYFTVALRMFEDAPLLGHGPGTWAVRRVTYTEPGELDHYIPHAHDIYLQTLAELGITGAVLGVLALVPLAWLVWRGLNAAAPDTRRWAWAALFVLLFLGLFNVLDFQMNVPAVLVLGALPVAWLDASTREGFGLGRVGASAASWVGRGAQVALGVGCVIAVVVLFRAESIATTHQTALAATFTADWEAARGPAEDAWIADPDYPPYAITRGLVASGEGDWETAVEAYGFAAPTDDMAQSWLGLAQAQEALGAPDAEVAASIERALRIGSQQTSIVFAAGALYDRLGDHDRAGALFAQTLTRYPSLAADPYWSEAGMDARLGDILELAEERSPGSAWEIALAAGEPDRARELAQGPLQPNIIDAWEGDADALEAVYAVADVETANPYVLGWASRLANRVGDEDQASRYRSLAVYEVIEGGELPGTEIEIDEDGWLQAVPAGTEVGFAGRYLYRRPLGPDLLPPGLPRLVFAGSSDDAAAEGESV